MCIYNYLYNKTYTHKYARARGGRLQSMQRHQISLRSILSKQRKQWPPRDTVTRLPTDTAPGYNCIFSTSCFATLPFFVKTSDDLKRQWPLRLQEMQDSSIFSFKPDELQQQQQEESSAAIAALPVSFLNVRESVQSRHQRHSAVTDSTPQLARLKTLARKDRKRAEPLKRATCR